MDVEVVSPQFRSTRHYQVWLESAEGRVIAAPSNDETTKNRNPYVERTLEVALLAARALLPAEPQGISRLFSGAAALGATLRITLRADNDFYSQVSHLTERGLPVSTDSLASLPSFLPCPLDDEGKLSVSKTGMGSSAALITSLSAAVLAAVNAIVLPDSAGTVRFSDAVGKSGGETSASRSVRLVHHVAQIAHGLAQGKVGSGFDVCAAAYGGMRYTRVHPETLKLYMSVAAGEARSSDHEGGTLLANSRTTDWDYTIAPFALPRGLRLMMADVRGGSETPGMVRKVLAWHRESSDGGDDLWEELGEANDTVEKAMHRLADAAGDGRAEFDAAVAACAPLQRSAWPSVSGDVPKLLAALADSFAKVRVLLKRMGDAAGVPIEPDDQTRLADATVALPGVVLAGVPGAGGNDALFAVVLDTAEVRARVEELWVTWPTGALCPLLLMEGAACSPTTEPPSGDGVRMDNVPK